MREAIYVVKSGEQVATTYMPIVEALARHRHDVLHPPEGAVEVEIWDSDNGRTRRHRFGRSSVAKEAGKSFEEGNKEVIEHLKENRRRQMEGLPTIEEEAELKEQQKAAVAAQVKASQERQMKEDERRKSQGRLTVAEEEAAAAARRREQDAAETAALRAHENTVRKAQGRMTLEEEDAFIEKRRLESLAVKGLLPAKPAAQAEAKPAEEAEAKPAAEKPPEAPPSDDSPTRKKTKRP